MTTVDTNNEIDLLRIRLNHIERRVMKIEARMSGLPPSEPIPFPITPQPPTLQSKHYCSFCGKAQEEVAVLIAGLGPFICNECVTLCQEIVEKRLAKTNEGS